MKSPVLALMLFFSVSALHAQTELKAYGLLPAAARDSGGDTLGGVGSAIDYDGEDRFFCVTDRGPGDGVFPYRPRIVALKITPIGDSRKMRVDLESSVILRDEKGVPFTGLRLAKEQTGYPQLQSGVNCIDPEGIALAPDGTIYISDEYGPYLYQFRRDGSLVRRIAFPEYYAPRDKNGTVDFSEDAKVASGRTPNRGFEGLSILPDGKTAVLILQSALAQDGGRHGPLTRILQVDLASGKMTAEYAYPFESNEAVTRQKRAASAGPDTGGLSVNDITAIDDHRFLVLERDSFGENGEVDAPKAKYKAVWLADIRGASNLLDPAFAAYRTRAGSGAMHPLSEATGLKPVGKKLLFNLPELKFDFGDDGPVAESLGAKWEGLAVFSSSPDGRIDLFMTSDNDFLTPTLHEDGQVIDFPRAKKAQDTLFLKIRTQIPRDTR